MLKKEFLKGVVNYQEIMNIHGRMEDINNIYSPCYLLNKYIQQNNQLQNNWF